MKRKNVDSQIIGPHYTFSWIFEYYGRKLINKIESLRMGTKPSLAIDRKFAFFCFFAIVLFRPLIIRHLMRKFVVKVNTWHQIRSHFLFLYIHRMQHILDPQWNDLMIKNIISRMSCNGTETRLYALVCASLHIRSLEENCSNCVSLVRFVCVTRKRQRGRIKCTQLISNSFIKFFNRSAIF